jgi:hypothetical protein
LKNYRPVSNLPYVRFWNNLFQFILWYWSKFNQCIYLRVWNFLSCNSTNFCFCIWTNLIFYSIDFINEEIAEILC